MAKQILSEEFRRMQRLAGIITEEQLNENVASEMVKFVSQNFDTIKANFLQSELEILDDIEAEEEDYSNLNSQMNVSSAEELINAINERTLGVDLEDDMDASELFDMIKELASGQLDEEKNLQEAEKTIQAYGPRLMDGLKKNGFDVKFVTNSNENDQLAKVAKTSDNKLAVIYYEAPTKFISITTNGKNQDEAFKVVDSPFVKELMPDEYSYQKQGGYFIEIQGK